MKRDVRFSADPVKNLFILRIGDRTIPLTPAQFEQLCEGSLEIAARHLEAGFRERGHVEKRNEPIECLPATDMQAALDVSGQSVVTRISIGILNLNFAVPRQVVFDYCAQVMHQLQELGGGQSSKLQ